MTDHEKIEFVIIDDNLLAQNVIMQAIEGSYADIDNHPESEQSQRHPDFKVHVRKCWDLNDENLYLNRNAIIITDCTGTGFKAGFKNIKDLGKFIFDKKYYLRTVCSTVSEKDESFDENELHKMSILRIYHGVENKMPNSSFFSMLNDFSSKPNLLKRFIFERNIILANVRGKPVEFKNKLMLLGRNIFSYYLKYDYLLEQHQGKYVAIVNGDIYPLTTSGDNKVEVIEELMENGIKDEYLVRKVIPIGI